jgi:hypothetical protein
MTFNVAAMPPNKTEYELSLLGRKLKAVETYPLNCNQAGGRTKLILCNHNDTCCTVD